MQIIWKGQSCFQITTQKTKSPVNITIDPFSPEIGLRPPTGAADIVLVTHDHKDHNAVDLVSGQPKIFTTPGEYEIGGISIVGVNTAHDAKQGSERGKNICFIIEMEEVRTIHLGDLGHTLSQEQLDQIGAVDIVLIPVGGKFTIGPQEAVEVVNQLEPRVVIPMHYKTESLKSKALSDIAPVDEFLKAMGVAGIKDTKYVTSYEKLPEELTLVVLENRG